MNNLKIETNVVCPDNNAMYNYSNFENEKKTFWSIVNVLLFFVVDVKLEH